MVLKVGEDVFLVVSVLTAFCSTGAFVVSTFLSSPNTSEASSKRRFRLSMIGVKIRNIIFYIQGFADKIE